VQEEPARCGKHALTSVSSDIPRPTRCVQRHPGDTRCLKEILGGIRKLMGRFSSRLCLKCSKTHQQASLIPNYFRGDTPGPQLKMGGESIDGKVASRLSGRWTPLRSTRNNDSAPNSAGVYPSLLKNHSPPSSKSLAFATSGLVIPVTQACT